MRGGIYFIAAAACLVMAGCVPGTTIVIERIAPPDADVSGIDEIAVLPFSAGNFAPSYAREATSRLVRVLASTGRYRVMKAREVERLISEVGISYAYPPDAALVRKIGNALEVDALIYGQVENFQFQEEDRLVTLLKRRALDPGRKLRGRMVQQLERLTAKPTLE